MENTDNTQDQAQWDKLLESTEGQDVMADLVAQALADMQAGKTTEIK